MAKLRISALPVKQTCRKRKNTHLWLVVFLVALLSLWAAYQGLKSVWPFQYGASVLAQQPSGTEPQLLSSEAHAVNIPYFTESDGLTSILTLNNTTPEPVTASVTIFNSKGEPLAVPSISLQPQLAARLSIRKLTAGAAGDFSSGNIQVSYTGPSMAVTCQVSVISERGRLSFESVETSAMEFGSNRLDGIAWVPDDDTQARAALTSVAPHAIGVAITSQGDTKKIRLSPRETRVVDLRQFLANKQRGSSAALVSLQHDGLPGDLIATGFALNPKTGFATSLHFVDSSMAASTRLAGAHVRFGLANPDEGFPAGTTFQAWLVVAHAGNVATEVGIAVDYTLNSEPKRVELPPIKLGPGELRQMELSQELAALGIVGPVENAGIDISYNGTPGSILARLTSLDATGEFSFDVPIKDPLSGGAYRISGNYPWRLDSGYNTVVHLKNTVDQEVYALVQVRYEGGNYNPERIKLAPYQTVAVNLRELRDKQEKDVRDGVMPKEVASGQVLWYEEEPGSLIGRAETFNLQAGVASSFSCGGVCPNCPPWYNSAYMSPASYLGVTAETGQPFRPMQTKRDCYGTILGPYDMTLGSTWASLNTSIATVTFGGQVTCLNPGGTSIRATFSVIPVACGFPSSATASPTGGLTVCDTNLAGPTSVTRGGSATYSICAQATGVSWQFSGGGGTASQSGGTSWSGTMVTSGTVTVSFTLKGLPYSRTKSVTVNARSWNTGTVSPQPGTVTTLPTPPTQASHLGAGNWSYSFSNPSSVQVPGGPNAGFKYYSSQLTITQTFKYQINSDLANSQSTFSQKQYGNCGIISRPNLLNNVTQHESGSAPARSHYTQYLTSFSSQANNPDQYLEPRVATPQVNAATFESETNSQISSKFAQSLADVVNEANLFGANQNQVTGQAQGTINWAPYTPCP